VTRTAENGDNVCCNIEVRKWGKLTFLMWVGKLYAPLTIPCFSPDFVYHRNMKSEIELIFIANSYVPGISSHIRPSHSYPNSTPINRT
jgi:hypothetical protein